MKNTLLAGVLTLCTLSAQAVFNKPDATISRADILRGTITPERAWWDIGHHKLAVKVDIANQSISGSNTISYRVLSNKERMQIDLQPPMKLDKAIQNGKELTIEQEGIAHFITLTDEQPIGSKQQVQLLFSGKPTVAKNAPWESGFTWTKDEQGVDFVATANQGKGPSIWWPTKDHDYDEPDNGIDMIVEVPEHLVNISNGRLINTTHNKTAKTKSWHWQVTSPINGYGVNLNIGDYVHFDETYQGEGGTLDMDYWVIRSNLEKAKNQFKEAKRTIEALEHWFGPYPFYKDSFKLVEVPYLGMEHQSSVTYGNGYQNGYKGRDRSESGAGMLFDFIIVHETGHEWFANNITAKDIADMWIHESFTSYSESLFLEYHFDQETGFKYVRGQRINIGNRTPIIGRYNIRYSGSGDMYDKGANMLHTMRQIVDDDKVWRDTLRGLNKTFWHQTVTTKQVEEYIIKITGKDFSKLFDQYLRDVRVPTIEIYQTPEKLKYRWSNSIKHFEMPLKVFIDGEEIWFSPTTQWQHIELDQPVKVEVDKEFYINQLIY